jgi:hypothetical protein
LSLAILTIAGKICALVADGPPWLVRRPVPESRLSLRGRGHMPDRTGRDAAIMVSMSRSDPLRDIIVSGFFCR